MGTSDWISSIALLISLAAAFFAGKSANEAKKANQFNLIETLAPHFVNIDRLLKAFNGKGITKEEIENAEKSLEHLKVHYKNEETTKIIECIEAIESLKDKTIGYRKYNNIQRLSMVEVAPENINEIKEYFENKKTNP